MYVRKKHCVPYGSTDETQNVVPANFQQRDYDDDTNTHSVRSAGEAVRDAVSLHITNNMH